MKMKTGADLRKKRGGFTLLELVVAIAIVLLIGAAVSPILLAHLKDAKVASLNENLVNMKAAFESWYTKEAGVIKDANNDGNYLDDMVNAGWLNREPTDPNFQFAIKKYTDTNGKVAYYIDLTPQTGAESTAYEIITKLDEKIDGGNGDADGVLQYTASNGTLTEAFYLLYKEAGMTAWH